MYHLKRSLRFGRRLLGGLFYFFCHSALDSRLHGYCSAAQSVAVSPAGPTLKIRSTTKKKSPKRNTVTITTDVVTCTSLREGVTTLRISARTSLKKRVSSAPTHRPHYPRCV